MILPLMLIPFILPRPPPLRSFATHDSALKAVECEMLAFVMSTKIVETSEVRVAVLIGTEETAFRESAEFRGFVGERATGTMLENWCRYCIWKFITSCFPRFQFGLLLPVKTRIRREKCRPKWLVVHDPKTKWPPMADLRP